MFLRNHDGCLLIPIPSFSLRLGGGVDRVLGLRLAVGLDVRESALGPIGASANAVGSANFQTALLLRSFA